MSHRFLSAVVAVVIATFASQSAHAEVSVKISKMHLCCGACVKGVEGALKKVEGATVKVDQDDSSAVVSAANKKTARKAISAIARAGFHGVTDDEKLKMPENSGVKEGKTKRLELIGVHNCCGGCNKAIKAAIAKVDGVEADTAKAKSKSIVIEGDFEGRAVVKALNDAGFHVRMKGAARERAQAKKKKTEK